MWAELKSILTLLEGFLVFLPYQNQLNSGLLPSGDGVRYLLGDLVSWLYYITYLRVNFEEGLHGLFLCQILCHDANPAALCALVLLLRFNKLIT